LASVAGNPANCMTVKPCDFSPGLKIVRSAFEHKAVCVLLRCWDAGGHSHSRAGSQGVGWEGDLQVCSPTFPASPCLLRAGALLPGYLSSLPPVQRGCSCSELWGFFPSFPLNHLYTRILPAGDGKRRASLASAGGLAS